MPRYLKECSKCRLWIATFLIAVQKQVESVEKQTSVFHYRFKGVYNGNVERVLGWVLLKRKGIPKQL